MRALALCLLLAAAGCRTTTSSVPSRSVGAPPAISMPVRAWEVVDTDEVVGVVVEFDELGAAQRRFFSVRNAWHQELGLIDASGRAFRYRPHVREAQWVCTGTVVEGAARILGADERTELIEVGVETLAREARALAAE